MNALPSQSPREWETFIPRPGVEPNPKAEVLAEIRRRLNDYARLFEHTPWQPDQLSDTGWLCLVAVPWLLAQLREQDRQQGKANGDPGADGVGSAAAALKLVVAEKSVPKAAVVVPTGNPLAKFLVGLVAKLMGVRFVAQAGEGPEAHASQSATPSPGAQAGGVR